MAQTRRHRVLHIRQIEGAEMAALHHQLYEAELALKVLIPQVKRAERHLALAQCAYLLDATYAPVLEKRLSELQALTCSRASLVALTVSIQEILGSIALGTLHTTTGREE